MKQLFLIGIYAGSIALSALSVQANDPSITPVVERLSASAKEEVLPSELTGHLQPQPQTQQASFTSTLAGPPVCDSATCGASQACDGGSSAWDIGCPLLSDEPLLGFLKNQPLDDCWTYSVGGELRYRFMDESNRLRPVDAGRPNSGNYDLWRFTPHLEVKQGDAFTAYVQAIDASIFNRENVSVTPIDQNRSDLLQFYADFTIAEGDEGILRARVGRQFLQYGSQHLVSPLGWSNTFRNFEGIKFYYSSEDWDIDAFATRPVNGAAGNLFRPTSADHPDQSKWFSGVYSTWKGTENQKLDLYWLWLNEEDADRTDRIDGTRHTIGARWEGKHAVKECDRVAGVWNWELEGAYQFGEESFRTGINEDIQAGFVSSVLGYTWSDVAWSPTLKGVFWYGSGDKSPANGTNNTVSTLFPLGHAHWGIIDNLNGSNLLDYSLQGVVKPTSKLTVVSALHWFDKAQSSDPIYNVANAPFPNPAAPGTTATNIGTELDIVATWQASKNLQFQSGYSWFWYGDAVTQDPAINRSDARFFYFMSTLTF
ncbi:MAG: alginate export family protein [Planctomycetota bacterium]|nr:alginate export family protein [Planctomycetota bacterium]MDA1162881.1 alginate export family protein [Planctomycetota bacterium]